MREFRQKHGRTGERYWQIALKARPNKGQDVVWSAWGGIVDGKHKQHGETEDIPGPKGKKNTKAYVDGVENAKFHMERAIRKKTEEGYYEVGLDGRPLLGGSADEIEWDRTLPKNLCFSKPKNEVSDKFLARREENQDVIYTRKMNGMMVVSQVHDGGEVSLYSRRMDDLTGHFPHLVDALQELQFPPKSILLWEAFLGEARSMDRFFEVQSIMRSKVDRALHLQAEEYGPMKFCLLRVPFWQGRHIEGELKCGELLYLMDNTFSDMFMEDRDRESGERILYTMELFDGTRDEAIEEALKEGYEGWVAYVEGGSFMETKKKKGEEVTINKSFSFHGKPDRPACCYKVKPDFEDDFICYWDPSGEFGKHCAKGCQYDNLKQSQGARHGTKCPKCGGRMVGDGTKGTGKHKNGVGTLSLYQIASPGGVLVYICEVGTGMSDEEKADLADPTLYPMVAAVKYNARSYISRGAKTNALTHPSVLHFREDKEPLECVNSELADGE